MREREILRYTDTRAHGEPHVKIEAKTIVVHL